MGGLLLGFILGVIFMFMAVSTGMDESAEVTKEICENKSGTTCELVITYEAKDLGGE